MDRYFAFDLEEPGLAGVRFLVRRTALPPVGDPESAFFASVAGLKKHAPQQGIGSILADALRDTETGVVVVIRNPNLVLDASLLRRFAAAVAALGHGNDWSLAGPGGLDPAGRRHLALYASDTPAIPDRDGPHPLVDVLPDLSVVNAAFARTVFASAPAIPDAALEPVLAIEGYLQGRVALFLPDLAAGINGALVPRDLDRLAAELITHFSDRLAGQSIATLSGPVVVPEATGVLHTRSTSETIDEAVGTVVAARCTTLTLSIVVRTRFNRDHLLRRLLTSLSRARHQSVEFEVILSSDADPAFCSQQIAGLQRDFGMLTLRLQCNATGMHSRIVNLLGGVRAARHDYVALIDDDDYVDLFAFDAIGRARFAGKRPLIVTGSEVHNETWEGTPSGRWVLSQSAAAAAYPAGGWREMFSGVNRLPVCALIMPRDRLLARLEAFDLAHDLSEDYALFLLLLTDPALPPILEVTETFCHISVRGAENSVTMADRRPWVRDISAYLSDLVGDSRVASAGLWALLTPPGATAGDTHDRRALEDTTAALARARADATLLHREVRHLRSELSQMREASA